MNGYVPEDSIELSITPAFALRGYLHTPAVITWNGKSRPGYYYLFPSQSYISLGTKGKLVRMEDFHACHFLDLVLRKFWNTAMTAPPVTDGM